MTRLKKKMKEIGIIHLLENIRGKGGSCELFDIFRRENIRIIISNFLSFRHCISLDFLRCRFIIYYLSAVLFLSAANLFSMDFHFKRNKKNSQRIINLADELQESYYISDILPKPGDLQNKAYYYAVKKSVQSYE